MELRHLRYFVTVAEELHVGRAAERLYMAQQPLSAAIRALERELGFDLFERYANRIRLTPAGDAFLADSRATLAHVDAAVDRARRAARGELGTVRIGFCRTAMDRVLPAAIAAFRTEYPSVGTDLRELSHREQVAQIERGDLDVGFLHRPVDEREFGVLDVLQERIVAVLPAGHPLEANAELEPRDLSQVPLIMFARENGACHAFVAHVLTAAGVMPRVAQEVSDRDSAVGLAAFGLGVALVPEHVVRHVSRPDVRFRPLQTAERLQFAAVWSRRAGESVVRRRFIDVLSRLIATSPLDASADAS